MPSRHGPSRKMYEETSRIHLAKKKLETNIRYIEIIFDDLDSTLTTDVHSWWFLRYLFLLHGPSFCTTSGEIHRNFATQSQAQPRAPSRALALLGGFGARRRWRPSSRPSRSSTAPARASRRSGTRAKTSARPRSAFG